jgi:hypothetical protein
MTTTTTASISTVASTKIIPSQGVPSGYDWIGDFSTGDFSQFDIAENTGSTVTDPTVGLTAGNVVLAKQVPGYTLSSNLCRTLASDGLPTSGGGAASTLWCHNYFTAAWLQNGVTTWFRNMFLLPDGTDANYPGVFTPRAGDGLGATWHIMMEWHLDDGAMATHGGSTAPGSFSMEIGWGGYGGPSLLLRPVGGFYGATFLDYYYETDQVQTLMNGATRTPGPVGTVQALKYNHWYDVLAKLTFSADPAVGHIDWYVDGNLRFSDFYPTLNQASDGVVPGCAYEGGIYRNTGLEPNSPNEFLYQGPMVAGPTRASVGG